MAHAIVVLWAALAVQVPDSAARARYAAALRNLSDSLSAVEAAAALVQADLVNASRDLVISRSARLTARCAGARAAARSLDSLLVAVPLRPPPPPPHPPLGRELAMLRMELTRCEAAFTTGRGYERADSVRAWAPHRIARLDDAVRRYRLSARTLMRRTGLE